MNELIASDDPFSAADKRALADILGYMIPAHGRRPAASDSLIFADFLATVRAHAAQIKRVLALYEKTTLEGLSQTSNADVVALVSFVVQCYYRDERVMADLEMEARPPHPRGYELAHDPDKTWALLAPVRKRGKIFRDV